MAIKNTGSKDILSLMKSALKTEAYETVIRLGKIINREKPVKGNSLYIQYFLGKAYEKMYDFTNATEYYLRMLQSNAFNMKDDLDIEITINTRIFFFSGLYLLGTDKYEAALSRFQVFLNYEEQNEAALYYAGIACLYLGRIREAVQYLQSSMNLYQDDAKLFALGCVSYLEEEPVLAKEFFHMALQRNPLLVEAQYNLEVLNYIINGYSGNNKLENILFPEIELNYMSCASDIPNYKKIPIFINSRDRVECLSQLVEWFLFHGYVNIFILDNASTYPPLKSYYDSLKKTPVKIIFLEANLGHCALWKSNVLDKLSVNTPYIYTDPDVLPIDMCPDNVVLYMLKVLKQNKTIQKVGLSLRIDDVLAKDIIQQERQFWELEFAPNLYYAYTDTTFALYRAGRRFYINEAIRIGYPYMCSHLPWYYDQNNLPVDEKYYIEHANKSSSFATRYRKSI